MDAVIEVSLQVDLLSGLDLHVIRVEARERLFEVYEVTVDCLVDDPVELERLLGESASVRLATRQGRARHWHGIVWSAEIAAGVGGDNVMRIVVTPDLRRLALGRDCRVFRDLTVSEIVDDVLRRGGLSDDSWGWHIGERLPAHTNVHQYNESDYAFVRRLLAEEGLSFAVENDTASARVRFFDSVSGLSPLPHAAALQYQPTRLGQLDTIFDLRERFAVTSGSTALQDHDLERPGEALAVELADSLEWGPEVYLHPGGFDHARAQGGATRAGRYLQALRRDRRVIAGRSDVPYLEPGRLFHVQGHDRVNLNDELQLVAVTHRCRRGEYERGAFDYQNEFEAIPCAFPHRPSPRRGRPVAAGLQHAFVTTPSGLDHHCDVYGRVKVRFLWDRSGVMDAESSTWARVGQLQLPGSLVTPRVGFEVLVDGEQGDADRPCVVGHVYNAETPLPYSLPGHATVSSWRSDTLQGGQGANEVRFDDNGGGEEMLLHASMTMRELVEHDAARRVTSNEDVRVGVHRALTVTGTFTSALSGDRDLTVGRTQSVRVGGDLSGQVGGSVRLTSGHRRIEVARDLVESVGGDLDRTVGPLFVLGALGSYSRRTVGSSTVTVGTVQTEQVAGDRVARVQGDAVEEIAALRYLEVGSLRLSAGAGLDARFANLEVEIGADVSGSASDGVELSAGSDLTVTAETVSITATNQLTVSAGSCELTLSASGQITLRAPRVNLRNADSLGSMVQVN
ncbi:MAG: type VI secretion system tip protein VgrG [Sandaracinaceae bacterium]|nr:MAG: type VI secretion system tip protein VgrG [Sandaracinaceae bacterium]